MTTIAPRLRHTTRTDEAAAAPAELEAERTRRRQFEVPAWLRNGSSQVTVAGLVVALIGFVLVAVAWGQVAGEAHVFLQLPYLVSAGFTGIGLMLVGLTTLNVAARQRDAVERRRQVEHLVAILEQLQAALAEDRGKR